ncbi:MAG: Type 1 glutamine amidotransferase-like domain-containing protein [Treponemataceae bacterium]
MKKLFLTSSFCDSANYLHDFYGDTLHGKTVSFIPTASLVEDYTAYIDDDKKAFRDLGVIVEVLNIEQKTEKEITHTLLQNEMIYVSGGNTFYLMQELRKTKVDKVIIEQIQKGKLYIGASAGSIIVSKNIDYFASVDDTDKAPELKNYAGLGIVDFYPLPHYESEPFTKAIEDIYQKYQGKIPLIPISNTQVIEVIGDEKTIRGKLR